MIVVAMSRYASSRGVEISSYSSGKISISGSKLDVKLPFNFVLRQPDQRFEIR